MLTPSRFSRWLTVAALGVSIGSCCVRQARFAPEEIAADTLTEEIARLGSRCELWFVRECSAEGMQAVWFFRPRIDGPAETAAYDGASGALLYQRQFGTSSDWAFAPVRQYGSAPACRPALDSSGAERACAWIEQRTAAAAASPAATATPEAPAPAPIPSPAP